LRYFTSLPPVEETGIFTIHTLVYDPETLDLGIVQFGVTTGFDVNGLLQQGGGNICAALDVAGAAFNVEACEECAADFGQISASSNESIPAGYELLYVLTSGEELIIEAVSGSPEFTVEETGLFTIHTLVYDPETLGLGIVQFGATTGFEVNGLLRQGGGNICAALDVAGAPFNNNGSVLLRAFVLAQPTAPAGFEVLYVLTSGEELIIEAVNSTPAFNVEETNPGFRHCTIWCYDWL